MELAELHLPRTVAYVGLVRLVVTSGARLAGLPDERLEDLKIAVSEAAAYAVTAGRDDRTPLVVAFGAHRGAFEVHVLDSSLFSNAKMPEALREWPDEGGLGLTLMEGLADEVVFPESSGSQLVLRFLLSGHSEHAGAAADASLRR